MLTKIIQGKKKSKEPNLIYKTGNKNKDKTYDFQKFKTRSFGRYFHNDELTLEDAIEKKKV